MHKVIHTNDIVVIICYLSASVKACGGLLMTEIYLIRHTQSEGNRYRIMQGHWDGNVTPLGEQEIELLAERFRGIPVDAVYSSDLYRARKTTTAVTRWADLPLNIDKRLREINVGPWEAQFFGNVFHDEPARAQLFVHDPDRFFLEGAETYAQVGKRAMAALREIAARHPGKTVAVVSHGVTIRCLISRILGVSVGDFKTVPPCANTGVTHLLWDGERFAVDFYADARHLEPLHLPAWSRNREIRHEPLDLDADAAFYQNCYADAWQSAHGDLEGYSAPVYLHAAQEHRRADPESVLRMLIGDEPVGLLDLDTKRGAHAGYGWISLLYLLPEYRHQGYGIQVLGRAYRKYESLGRRSVRLNVASENTAARAFYEKEGFARLGESGGLLLLEKKLGRQGR